MASHFKCNSCLIQFLDSDAQRYHMKTDWHRYNLKRRVAGLTPVDAAVFAEKLNQSKKYEEKVDEFGFKVLPDINNDKKHRHNLHITRGRNLNEVDHKREISPASISGFSSFSLGDSVYSKAGTHSDIESNFETGSEAGTHSDFDDDYQNIDDDENNDNNDNDNEILETSIQPITSCIYCGLPHTDLEVNVTHMFKNHGLYLPERSYLIDLKGLLEFLISIIVLDNECLCCNFKGKNLESIRAHVTSKGHCRLPFETKEEKALLSRFYDFSPINSEIQPSSSSNSNKKVGFNDTDEINIISDNSDDENGINDNYTVATIDPIDSQLSLPNGSRLGHRSLQRYYRQNVHVPVNPSQGQLTISTADRRLSNGLTIQEHKKHEKLVQLTENKLKNKNVIRDVKRGNFQPHYRDTIL